jgi:tRNA nucleotidyltransferase (CCA-adding enzyme)
LRSGLLDAVRRQPGGEALLEAADESVHLVGGAVRDLLRGERPRELDVLVEGEIEPLLRRLGGEAVVHDRFGTASVSLAGAQIDLARARRERYPLPGALPEVEPASIGEDLLRRDFTVNAMAASLTGAGRGEIRAVDHACEDLAAGRMRVLYERSFLDDPTRLLRLARYAARLGFAVERRTAELARQALAAGALETVSGARLGAELRLALAEPDQLAALAQLDRLGLLSALDARLRFDPALLRSARELLAPDAGGDGGALEVLALAALVLPLALADDPRSDSRDPGPQIAALDPGPQIASFLDRLEFPASTRNRVVAAAAAVPRLLEELPGAGSPSRLRELAGGVPPEGVALTGASSRGALGPARRWLGEVRHVRLRIDGDDLLAAGIPEGPELGRRLEETLRRRLDGELADERSAQLRAALEGM